MTFFAKYASKFQCKPSILLAVIKLLGARIAMKRQRVSEIDALTAEWMSQYFH